MLSLLPQYTTANTVQSTAHHRLMKHPQYYPADDEGPQPLQKVQTALALVIQDHYSSLFGLVDVCCGFGLIRIETMHLRSAKIGSSNRVTATPGLLLQTHRHILSDTQTASEINSDILNYTVSMCYLPVFNISQFMNNGSLFPTSVTAKSIRLIHMTT